jgi:hypothetical protein
MNLVPFWARFRKLAVFMKFYLDSVMPCMLRLFVQLAWKSKYALALREDPAALSFGKCVCLLMMMEITHGWCRMSIVVICDFALARSRRGNVGLWE